ncbi:IS30 family transposase [Sphingomonas trueperi]
MAAYIRDRLEAAWSPEQIAGYLRRHRTGSGNVCHETIYQYVYSEDGKRQQLWKLLPMARKKRRSRYGRKPRAARIPEANTIAQRPPEIAERNSFGHWEGDLIVFARFTEKQTSPRSSSGAAASRSCAQTRASTRPR